MEYSILYIFRLWFVYNYIAYSKDHMYYDPKLGLDCNLNKGLSKDEEDDQLVKCKDTGLYLQLYISSDYKE